ncbi:2815_t:CDS:2, partial [Funneliformis mosseae]
LSYEVCNIILTDDVIHINEHDAHFYTNSTKVKKIESYNQTSDGSTSKVTPVASKQLPYTCVNDPSTSRVDLKTEVLNNNTEITSKDDKNNLNCLYAYSNQMYDSGTTFNFENDGDRWPFTGQNSAALSIIATLDNAFTFYQNHYLGIKYSFSNITENIYNHLTDFAHFYNHVPDDSIYYDITGTLQNFVQPSLNAAVASTILNHYGFTYCNNVDKNLCGTCCSAQGAGTAVGGVCVIIGRYDCGQLIHNNCVFGGVNYKPDTINNIRRFIVGSQACAEYQDGGFMCYCHDARL